ncbi:MAG TPA: AraC family transcriptional regulator [Rhodoferax sp.]
MQSNGSHHIYRHPSTPWLALRVSAHSSSCYRTHTHAEYSVGIVDDGDAIFHHPGGPEKVQRGSVVLIEPEVIHACNPRQQQVWSYRMLFVEAEWLHAQIAAQQGSVVPITALHFAARTRHDPATSELVDQLCQPSATDAAAAQQGRQLSQWLASMLRPGAPRDLPTYPVALEPALQRVHAGLDTGVTVRELARHCDMSPSQFTRRFKGAMGVAPAQYLQNLRVNGARRLIARGASLAEAAHTMGFADQAHMQRAFKVRHAMTPGSYAPASG